jgi:hypothetical protein
MAATARIHPPSPAELRRRESTLEIDGSWRRSEIREALRQLRFDPREKTRLGVLIDRDVRDLLVELLR